MALRVCFVSVFTGQFSCLLQWNQYLRLIPALLLALLCGSSHSDG